MGHQPTIRKVVGPRLGAPFTLSWQEANKFLDALEDLKVSAVRDNPGVAELIKRLNEHTLRDR